LGEGFGVKGRVGVWVVVLSPSFVSHHLYGSLKTIQVKEKKRQARADCVRPSRFFGGWVWGEG
jgi:hypothetical protein